MTQAGGERQEAAREATDRGLGSRVEVLLELRSQAATKTRAAGTVAGEKEKKRGAGRRGAGEQAT